MFKRLLSVGGFTLLSRITGFLRDMLMAWYLGKGMLSDAFIVAFLFPNYFRSIFGEGTINPAFLPRYAALWAKGEKNAAALFADRVFSWQMSVQFVVLILAMAFMPTLMHLIAPGFADNPGQLKLTVSLARITFPYLILTLVAIQISAMLNAIEKFWAAAAWSNFQNLGMIATLLASQWFPNAAYAAAWGVLARRLRATLLHAVGGRTRRHMLAHHLAALDAGDQGVLHGAGRGDGRRRELSHRALHRHDHREPAARRQPDGALLRRPHQPIAAGRARHRASARCCCRKCRRGWRSATEPVRTRRRTVRRRCRCCSRCRSRPRSWRSPTRSCARSSQHGAFDKSAAALSAIALASYGVGLPAMALTRIFQATFYARHDTVTPARITVTAIAVNIALKFLLVWGFHLGIAGIALGTSLGAWTNVALLILIGRRRELLQLNANFWRSLGPIVLAGVATGAVAYGAVVWGGQVVHAVWQRQLVLLVLAMVASGIVYGAILLIFRRRLPLGWSR